MSDPYFSIDGSARRMEGEVLAVCVRGDARRRWRWRQGEVEDELPFQRDRLQWGPFGYTNVVGGDNATSVALILDFQRTEIRTRSFARMDFNMFGMRGHVRQCKSPFLRQYYFPAVGARSKYLVRPSKSPLVWRQYNEVQGGEGLCQGQESAGTEALDGYSQRRNSAYRS
jgi:hypothetical protein